MCCNLQTIFQSQDIDKNRTAAVGTSSTNVVFLMDRQGRPLCNAISLHDQRSGPQVEWLRENIREERIRALAANCIANGLFSLSVLRRLVENRPDLIKEAHKLMMPCGYVIQKFTGEFIIDRPRMSLTLMADIRIGQWDTEITEQTGLLAWLPPSPCGSAEVVGTVT